MAPRLGRPIGSVTQFGLATIPFLILFIYFLVQATLRPQPMYGNRAWMYLKDMVWVMLAFLALFVLLGVYVAIFIPLRRALIKSYLEEGQTVVGTVYYGDDGDDEFHCFRKCWNLRRYGTAVYPHPEKEGVMIRKEVRVFQYYTREGAGITYFPGKPFSGQPKEDLEMDMEAASENRDKTRRMMVIVFAWVIFLLLAPIYIITQMGKVYWYSGEDEQAAWSAYGLVVGIFIPIVAFGGCFIRWLMYRYWILNMGTEVEPNKPDDTPYTSMT